MSLLSTEMGILGHQERRHKEEVARLRAEAEEQDRETLEKLRRLAAANQALRAKNEELQTRNRQLERQIQLERQRRRIVVVKKQRRDALDNALERELYE